jgi:MtN3 and saliva related transmembrane protein
MHWNLITAVGIIGGVLVTASLIPQFVKVLKSRSARDLSFLMFFMFFVGEIFWCFYAGYREDWVLLVFKIMSGILAMGILVGIWYFSTS